MFDLFDVDLLNEAITHRPTEFNKPARELLHAGELSGYFLTTEEAPPWYLNSNLHDDQRNAAAAVHVWLVDWVRPVLDAIAKDADATAVITKALPKPRLPKKPAKDGRGQLRSDSAWDEEFQSGPVFLWSLWAGWDDLVGAKRPVPPAPEYPGLEGLPVENRERFKTLIATSPVVTLSLDATKFTRQATAALRWLRAAFAKRARQADAIRATAPTNAAQKLRAVAAALREWGRKAGSPGRNPSVVPDEERKAARQALLLAVKNLDIIDLARRRYGCAEGVVCAGVFDLLSTAAAEHRRGSDLGGYWCWAHDLTGKHLPGNVSFPDELGQWASSLEREPADSRQVEADTPPKSSAADHEELRRMEAADPVLSEPPQYRDTTWPGVFIEAGGSIPAQWRAGADKKWRADYTALADRTEDMAADRRESPARRKAARELAGLLKQYLAFGTPKKKGGWFVAWGPEARKHLDKMDHVGSPMQALAVRLGLASSSQPVYVPSATVRGRTLDERLARQQQITKAWAAGGARQERDEKVGARKPTKPKSPWKLDTKRQRVRVGGKWYDLSDEQKCVLSVLIAAKGAWVQGRDLGKRPDKTIKAMPKPVQRIIESRKGTGYGYRLLTLLPE
ncbi:MAG: hypothetical protein WBD75_00900 [Phycisphaerae bacterium]